MHGRPGLVDSYYLGAYSFSMDHKDALSGIVPWVNHEIIIFV
jgi:hypothetical protein